MELKAALNSPNFAYTRTRSWKASGTYTSTCDLMVYVYHHDETSPSGVIQVAATTYGEAQQVFAELGESYP